MGASSRIPNSPAGRAKSPVPCLGAPRAAAGPELNFRVSLALARTRGAGPPAEVGGAPGVSTRWPGSRLAAPGKPGLARRSRGDVESAQVMHTPQAIPVPVPVLRLPRGPDGFSRGFAPDGRRARLRPEAPEIQGSPSVQECQELQEQRARAALRERYLRSLLAMVGRPVSFTLHEGVHVTAHFGATDLDVANFYVSQLQTPIGVQAEALLRCSDIISYTFKL